MDPGAIELIETQERLDFTERMIAGGKKEA